MKLEGKICLVTGSSDGIGKEIALKLAVKGARVGLLARSEEKLLAVKKECESLGAAEAEIFLCDLKNISEIKSATSRFLDKFGGIDILINNAGVWQKIKNADEVTDEEIQDVISTNLTGLIQITKELLPSLKTQSEAAIVNISSKSGVTAQVGQSVYTASKWGVKGYTDVLKNELKDSNVRVAGIYQSGTSTDMFLKSGDDFPVEKFTKPEDLAEVLVFMLSRPERIWLNEVHVNY